mmetsp:Transcript_1734/g.5060  ORF Transcript_1734/g.5060 Transcript_1734/m.5060 type:complete len:637 (+) Transcript_1734:88-1998(+)
MSSLSSQLPPSPSAGSSSSACSSLDCPICLCPLSLASPIGICAPCGHPFHPACYYRWAAQSATAECDRSHGRERRAKCPSCSQHVDAFAENVFLGAAVRNGGGLDDDDGAVSSSSSSSSGEDDSEDEDGSDDDDEREWNEEDTNNNADRGADNSSGSDVAADADADDEPEVICLDDETAGISTQIQALSPPPAASSSSSKRRKKKRKRDKSLDDDNADDDDGLDETTRKYKSKAKRYKRRVRALEAQTTERNQHHVRITSRLHQIEERERQLQREKDDVQGTMDQHEDKMTALELDLSRAQRRIRTLEEEVTLTKRENGQLRRDRNAVDSQMQQIRQKHQREMEAAQAVGMSEVEELQRERPRMVEELRRLKEALNKANRQLRAATNGGNTGASSSSMSGAARSSNSSGKQLNPAAAAVAYAREMRNAKDAREEDERREAKRQKEREQKKQMARKISSQAARMSRAARGGTAKVAPARQNSANAALGGGTGSSSGLSARDKNRQRDQGMQPLQLSSGASSRRRMDASSSVGFFEGGILSPEIRSISGNASSLSRSSSIASANSFGGTNSNVGSGLILLGNTSSLRRSNSTMSSSGGNNGADMSSSAAALASLARPSLPVIAGRKKNDIRAMFAKKR